MLVISVMTYSFNITNKTSAEIKKKDKQKIGGKLKPAKDFIVKYYGFWSIIFVINCFLAKLGLQSWSGVRFVKVKTNKSCFA